MRHMAETVSAAHIEEQGERKFLLDVETASEIWGRASKRLRPQLRDASRPITYHRTTYFDTPDHAYFRGTGGLARRIRVREYATASVPGAALSLMRPCFLELKQSAHGMRSKARLELEAPEVGNHLEQFGGAGLTPCLTTWYKRSALTDDSESVRLTLDSELAYCPPHQIGGPCSAEPVAFAKANALVLEIKTWGKLPSWLAQLVRTLREASDFSKFRAGMQAAAICASAAMCAAATSTARLAIVRDAQP